jgi:hypothetical protein
MRNVLFVGAILVGLQEDAQGQQPPVFHAEAYVVTQLVCFYGDAHALRHGLASADFQGTVNKESVPIDVSEDAQKPGCYVLSINPPSELRDGKSHRINVKVRNWAREGDKWRDLPLKWTAVFEKPRLVGG